MKFHTIKKLKTNQMKNNLFDTDCADRHWNGGDERNELQHLKL
jgi:hypothetical protein